MWYLPYIQEIGATQQFLFIAVEHWKHHIEEGESISFIAT